MSSMQSQSKAKLTAVLVLLSTCITGMRADVSVGGGASATAFASAPVPTSDLTFIDYGTPAAAPEEYVIDYYAEEPDSYDSLAPMEAPLAGPSPIPVIETFEIPECGALGEDCCEPDLTCFDGLACNLFDGGDPKCEICGGEGDICCFGEDDVFFCNSDALLCDFDQRSDGPVCMADASAPVSEDRTRDPRRTEGDARRAMRYR